MIFYGGYSGNMKKLLVILMAALLICSLVSCNKKDDETVGDDNRVADEKVYGNFIYEINGDATCEITGFTYTGIKEIDVEIPEEIDSLTVTGIGADAFKAFKTVKSVKIPSSIEYIAQFAFYDCDAITTIVIPDSVKTIGVGAFWQCDNLTTVTLPQTLKSIENYTFMECKSLTGVILPEGLESIGNAAFWGCKALTEITVPTSVKDMGDAAFYLCESLNKATVLGDALGKDEVISEKETVEHKIGEIVFNSCSKDLIVVVTEGTAFASYAEANKYNVSFNVVAE